MRSLLLVLLMAMLATYPPEAWAQGADSNFDRLIAEAQSAQSVGNFEAAANAYQRATTVNSAIPELWANLGLMEHQIGNYDDSIASFQRALRLNSHLVAANLFLGIDLLEQKRYEEALPYLRRAEKLGPTDPQPAVALGRAYRALHQAERASDAYAKALRMDEKNADAWFGLGVTALEEVERDARLLVANYKSSPFVDALTAEALVEEGKPIEASTYFERATAATTVPLCVQTEYALLLLRQHQSGLAQTPLRKEIETGTVCPLTPLVSTRAYLERDEEQTASGGFDALGKVNEDVLETNAGLVWKGITPSESARILKVLDKQTGLASESQRELLRQGVSGETQAAAPLTGALVVRLHSCVTGNDSLGKNTVVGASGTEAEIACAFYSGDYWSASVEARQMQSSSLIRAAGLYWEIKSNGRLAVAALARAGEEAPDSPQMYVLIGDIQRQRKHLEEAQLEYKKALALKPADPGALLGFGVTRFLMGDLTGALNAGQALLQENHGDSRTNLLVGEVLVGLHRYQDAGPYLSRSLDVDPELLSQVHALLGQCYAAGGQDTKAVQEFKLALNGDEDGSVHYQLALLYRKSGDKTYAATLFEESRRLHQEQLQRATIALQEILQTGNN